jgi:hypothetical protein
VTADHSDTVLIGFAVWALPLLAAIVIAAGIVDGMGAQESDHAGPVPAGVSKVSNKVYVQPASMLPVCGQEADSVAMNVEIGANRLVKCGYDQHWNVKDAISPNYHTALGRVLSSLPFWILAPLWTLLVWGGLVIPTALRTEHSARLSERTGQDEARILREERLALAERDRTTALQLRLEAEEHRREMNLCGQCNAQCTIDGDYLCTDCRKKEAA